MGYSSSWTQHFRGTRQAWEAPKSALLTLKQAVIRKLTKSLKRGFGRIKKLHEIFALPTLSIQPQICTFVVRLFQVKWSAPADKPLQKFFFVSKCWIQISKKVVFRDVIFFKLNFPFSWNLNFSHHRNQFYPSPAANLTSLKVHDISFKCHSVRPCRSTRQNKCYLVLITLQ